MDLVRIHGLELDCIVGIRPQERTRAQRLRLDLALGIDTRAAGRSGRIAATVDYDRVARDVVALLEFRRYRLIEEAAEELCALLLGAYPATLSVQLKIEKPGGLKGRANSVSVEVQRTRDDLLAPSDSPTPSSDNQGNPAHVLLQTRDASLLLLDVPSGQTLQPVPNPDARWLNRIISGQLYRNDGQVWAAGLPQPDSQDDLCWHANGAACRVFRCVVLTPTATRTSVTTENPNDKARIHSENAPNANPPE